MSGLICRIFPVPILINVNESKPRLKPLAMLNVSGVATSVINAGKASVKSCQWTLAREAHMSTPRKNQGRCGCKGWNSGDKRRAENCDNKESRNEHAAQARSRARDDPGGVTRDLWMFQSARAPSCRRRRPTRRGWRAEAFHPPYSYSDASGRFQTSTRTSRHAPTARARSRAFFSMEPSPDFQMCGSFSLTVAGQCQFWRTVWRGSFPRICRHSRRPALFTS